MVLDSLRVAVDVFEMVVDDCRWFRSCVLSVYISVDYRTTIGRLSVDCRSAVGLLSVGCRSTVGRLSVNSQPIVDLGGFRPFHVSVLTLARVRLLYQ